MNETIRSIMSRFSCRDYEDIPLTEEQLKTIGNAALAAPSAINLQPWHVIVITDKKLLEDLEEEAMKELKKVEDKAAYQRIIERGGKVFYNAPCMVVVASDSSKWAPMDCGILSQNIALAAHSLGLGSVICGMGALPLRGDRKEEFRKRMQFPEGYDFSIAVLVGTVKTAKEPHELDKDKLVFI